MENKDSNTGQWLNDRLSALRPDATWQPDVALGLAALHTGRRRQRVRARRRIGIAISLAVIVAGLLAFPMTRSLAQQYATACMSLLGLSNSGTNLTYANADYRRPVPALTLADGTGRPVTLAGLNGKVVVLTFWAPNCPACDNEISWFREFEQKYGGKRLVFLNHQVTAGADPIVDSFGGLDPIPTTLLIDKSGRIAVTHGGPCTKGEFDIAIRALLNER